MLHSRQPAQLWRYFCATTRGRQIIHFLHISKTGGTAVKSALRGHLDSDRAAIFLHEHTFRLTDVAVGEKAVMFFRDPLRRFVSAFYSRQRCGRPRYDVPWKAAEAAAFAVFHTPNELARALSSHDSAERAAAHSAMSGIGLIRDSFSYWIHSDAYFRTRAADVLFVGAQENLPRDFERLKTVLGLPRHLALPTDAANSHRNPEGLDMRLDDLAHANLTAWYARDIEFLAHLQRQA